MASRLLVDLSALMWTCLLAGKDNENGIMIEHEGKPVHVQSAWFGYDNAVSSLVATLDALRSSPADVLFVREAGASRKRRQQIYPDYKLRRGPGRPEQLKANFNEANDNLLAAFRCLGAQSVTQDEVEADDVIAYLCHNLPGKKVIVSSDGDLSQLLGPDVSMWRMGAPLTANPYGPFEIRYIALYKALVGDPSDNYKGAKGFGTKAWLDLLVNYGAALGALEGMIRRRTLHELADDVAEFKPFQRIIDSAQHVYESYDLAVLRPEWVNTEQRALHWVPGDLCGDVEEHRLRGWAPPNKETHLVGVVSWQSELKATPVERKLAVFDIELIGDEHPVFLLCYRVPETGEHDSFWGFIEADIARMRKAFERNDLTWVSFNGINFDAPILSAALEGKDEKTLKQMAQSIIDCGAKHWELPDEYHYRPREFDHIDLAEVAPGVRISLKAYAGRMGYPTMVDLPFAHDQDLTRDQLPTLEAYCANDLGVTAALAETLRAPLALRERMQKTYGIDLRSKSDAQIAEAIMRKRVGLRPAEEVEPPASVRYRAPALIATDSEVLQQLIARLESTEFRIGRANGRVIAPEWLDTPIELGSGTYQFGVGGLHSTHDKHLHISTEGGMRISDFDVASYYPNIMLNAGFTPALEGGKGEKFIAEYRKIYEERMRAKRAGNKQDAGSLKIVLNGTFGKLGSIYSAFYAPQLMLAVTLTGQLNLACLIHEIEKVEDVRVLSANTDGIAVHYPQSRRNEVLSAIAENAARTGFAYEETCNAMLAMKDVNNYFAFPDAQLVPAMIGADGELSDGLSSGEVKRKGLYAEPGLMKNPTMNVCAEMAIRYLRDGVPPERAIEQFTDIRDFVAVRAVKGGGVQPELMHEVDDWVLVEDNGDKTNLWMRQAWLDEGRSPSDPGGGGAMMRKSRPKPVEVYVGGQGFGRIARWYMSTAGLPPIVYAGSGYKVPKTDGARVCMSLPAELPEDLDKAWYVRETYDILRVLGVDL